MELVWPKEKLGNASFIKTQFWTETRGRYLVDPNDANGADLLWLRFWLDGHCVGKIGESLEL